jgi:hypothetical protein
MQSPKSIGSEYKDLIEVSVMAIKGSSRLFKNRLRYRFYESPNFYKYEKLEALNLKISEEVTSLYVSGNKASNKSNIKRFIVIGFVGLAAFFGVMYFVISKFSGETKEKVEVKKIEVDKPIERSLKIPEPTKPVTNGKSVIVFKCINNLCTYKDIKMDYNILFKLVSNYSDVIYLGLNKDTLGVVYLNFLGDSTFTDLLKPKESMDVSNKFDKISKSTNFKVF